MDRTSITASQARTDLYNLLRKAGSGVESFEITLRGAEPAILMSKSEVESWLETLDIMSSPQEAKALTNWKKNKDTIPLSQIMQELNIDEEHTPNRGRQKRS